jgi:uncharacterized protein YraI
MPVRTCIMLGAGLFVIAIGIADAAPVTTRNQSDLRAGPGSTFSVIGHIPAGTLLEATNCAGGWCQVGFNGIVGFVGAADLGTARRNGNASPVLTETAHRSHGRVSHRSTPDNSATGAAPSKEGSKSSAHVVMPSAHP